MSACALARMFYDWKSGESIIRSFFSAIKPVPGGIVFGTDLKMKSFPWVTAVLIYINTIMFFVLPDKAVSAGTFFPYGSPSLVHILFSTFSSAFLHADFSHLMGNMFFLWAFGSMLESRVGSSRFFGLYFKCIVLSNLLVLFFLFKQAFSLGIPVNSFHSLGASGAISGLIGVFAVRCFFANIKLSLPFFGIPFLSIPLKVQATLLIALFFFLDVRGSVIQFTDEDSHIDYWAHVGGYLGGLIMGFKMRMYREASKEALEARAERLMNTPFRRKDAMSVYKDLLKQDPENETALYCLFRHYKINPMKSEPYFLRIMQILTKKNFPEAVRLFEDNYPYYMNALPGWILLRLGHYFYNIADLPKAWQCLERASEKQGPWQPKSLFTLGLALEEMGQSAMAKETLENVTERYRYSPFHEPSLRKLAEIV